MDNGHVAGSGCGIFLVSNGVCGVCMVVLALWGSLDSRDGHVIFCVDLAWKDLVLGMAVVEWDKHIFMCAIWAWGLCVDWMGRLG